MEKNIFYLNNAKLKGYKSIEDVNIDFDKGLNFIIGKNSSGKTNFLHFIDKAINLKFNDLNNFNIHLQYQNNFKDVFDFYFSKSAKIVRNNIEDKNLLINKLSNVLNLNFEGILDITPNENNFPKAKYSTKESSCDTIKQSLRELEVSFTSTLIRHGVPNNYFCISEPLNIPIFNKNITDELLKLMFTENIPLFTKKILYHNIIDSVIFESYFKKRLRKKESIENYERELEKIIKDKILNKFLFVKPLSKLLKDYSPIEDIRFNENINIEVNYRDEIINVNNFYLEFKQDNIWYSYSNLSDGTKRIFYIISEIFIKTFDFYENKLKDIDYNENRIFLIEEPELGIHPHQLYSLMDFLKDQSRNSQIIITTHSPQSLDILTSEELNKIIISKKVNGKTQFHKLNKDKVNLAKEYMKEINLSDYWLKSDLED
ncbi:AAA family ATPase [Empedobacter falsenii]